jgi:hypothetical protein
LRVLIENRAPVHARAEIAKAALGGAKRDLDVNTEAWHISNWSGVHLGAHPMAQSLDAAALNPAPL